MAKHKYIETPEKLYEVFLKYAEDTKSRVRRIPKATNKGVQYEEHTPPLTIDGFKTYCNKSGYDINRYWYNVDNSYSEYVSIVTRIKEEIRNDQIEGALVGQYQQNIVDRPSQAFTTMSVPNCDLFCIKFSLDVPIRPVVVR